MRDRRLKDRTAIVTGAGRGLGRAIAEELGLAGARVAIVELDRTAGVEAAGALADLGIETLAVHADITQSGQVNAAFDEVAEAFGPLDIAVNNAGISRAGPHIQDVTDEDWNASLEVLQSGVFYGMRAAARLMTPRRSGVIVNISSVRGFSPFAGRMSYSPPKAAVIMMTKIAAAELGPLGVRVISIAPGFIKTPMHDADVARGVFDEESYLNIIPARRLGMPREVGRLAVYLCSEDAAYITGTCVTIDGGLSTVPAG